MHDRLGDRGGVERKDCVGYEDSNEFSQLDAMSLRAVVICRRLKRCWPKAASRRGLVDDMVDCGVWMSRTVNNEKSSQPSKSVKSGAVGYVVYNTIVSYTKMYIIMASSVCAFMDKYR